MQREVQVNKTIHEFRDDVGSVYVTRDSDIDPFEVWFEDFYILGKGNTVPEALADAALYASQLLLLIATAMIRVNSNATPAPSGE